MICTRNVQIVSFLCVMAFPFPAWADEKTDAIKELQREVKAMRLQMKSQIDHLKRDLEHEHVLREREHTALLIMTRHQKNEPKINKIPLGKRVYSNKKNSSSNDLLLKSTIRKELQTPSEIPRNLNNSISISSSNEKKSDDINNPPLVKRPREWMEGRNTPPDHGLDLSLKDFQKATESSEVVEFGGMRIGFPSGRPTLSSKDGHYAFSAGLVANIDIGGFPSSDGQRYGNAGRFPKFNQNARRLRLPLSWRYNNLIVSLTPEWGRTVDGTAGLYEANITYAGINNTKLVLGYYQPRVTLYDSQSSNDFQQMERPSVSEVVRSISAGDARMTIGGKTHGKNWFASGYLTGQTYGDRSADSTISDSQMGSVVRVAGRPIATKDWDMHLAVSGTMSFKRNQNSQGRVLSLTDRPETRLTNDRLVGTGTLLGVKTAWAIGPEFALRYRSLLVQGEYYHIGINREQRTTQTKPNLGFNGYYVSAAYTLLGHPRRYRESSAAFTAPQAIEEFNPSKGYWGALEVAGHWSVMNFNSHTGNGRSPIVLGGLQGGKQTVLGTGFNWYLNRHYRVQVQYSHIHATPSKTIGSTNTKGRSANMIGTRFQAAF